MFWRSISTLIYTKEAHFRKGKHYWLVMVQALQENKDFTGNLPVCLSLNFHLSLLPIVQKQVRETKIALKSEKDHLAELKIV